MRWTNKQNLPTPIVNAVVNDKYTKGESDISVTGLMKPPRMRVLQKLHQDDIVLDVSSRIDSLLGKALHNLLEEHSAGAGECLAEVRFFLKLDGITISGQFDAFYADGTLEDYKLCPIRKFEHGVPDEFTAQLNMYVYLMKHGYVITADNRHHEPKYTVTGLTIRAFYRDWFASGLKRGADYPPGMLEKLTVELWPEEKTLGFIKTRIALHKAANKKLPLCTDEDRWARPEKFAVMKPGAKKSLKNHDTREAAEAHASTTKDGYVEHRPGESVRCTRWCDVASFCTQRQNELRSIHGTTETNTNQSHPGAVRTEAGDGVLPVQASESAGGDESTD